MYNIYYTQWGASLLYRTFQIRSDRIRSVFLIHLNVVSGFDSYRHLDQYRPFSFDSNLLISLK